MSKKRQGPKPYILVVAAGSLALTLTACKDNSDAASLRAEQISSYLVQNGFRTGPTPGFYFDPEGNLISEEEALNRTGRTIRRGFGRFGVGVVYGGGT
jgi:hypothetical protein